MIDYFAQSLKNHAEPRGKFTIQSKFPLNSADDLSIAYTPGVAAVCEAIHERVERAYPLTMKGNSVAVLSDGSSVLGLGNIGPEAALPVMEGKAILFKEFADIDAIPIVVNTSSAEELIAVARAIAPTFGGINLEDVGAPMCFEVERALQSLSIPVFHDDQHGTAIVARAAIENACRISGKRMDELTVVINGAGAAGTAIAKMLRCVGHDADHCTPVKEMEILQFSNHANRTGTVHEALEGADVFVGVSRGDLLDEDDIRRMADDPIILAMANPIPEIMPDRALAGGALVVGTGRSDFPNQVNNVRVFPGIFRGALDAGATSITERMKMAAVEALAHSVEDVLRDKILPNPLDKSVAPRIAAAVAEAAVADGVARNLG